MSTKNPFEIRTEVLHMAKDYLDRQHNLNLEFAKKAYDVALETGKATQEMWKDYQPKMYSITDVLSKAQELYGFVSKKD